MKPTKTVPLLGSMLPQDLPLLPPPALNPSDQAPVVSAKTQLDNQELESSAHTEPSDSAPVSSAQQETGDQAPPASAPPEPTDPTPVSSVQSESDTQVPTLSTLPGLVGSTDVPEPGALVPVPESTFEPIPGIVFGSDGRFRRVVRLNRHERRFLRKFEPELDTMDLKTAKELILSHLHADRISTINVAFTLLQIRDRYLFTQDNYLDFSTWLKVESKEIGISIGYAYRLISIAEALDRYLMTTFMGQWHMTRDDVIQRSTQLSYFMTGIYRHISLDDLKDPFLRKGSPVPFISFVTGRKIPTPEEVEAARAARHQPHKGRPLVITTTDLENQIVDTIRLGLDVYIVGLKDLNDAPYIEKALLANRRKEADAIFSARIPDYINKGGECKDFLTIRTLEDAKFLILYHQAEGIPHRLVVAAICARLEDDPVLVAQWKALGYEKVHEYLIKDIGVTFDTYHYCRIGRNYLENEATILSHTAIDTEVQFSKLYNFDTAITIHGDEPALLWRYFGPDATVGEWDYFALHREYQKHFAEQKMSPARIKKARSLLFEFTEARAADERTDEQLGPLAGTVPYPFAIVAPHEKRLIDLFRSNPPYLLKYVKLYFEYKDKGLL